jgi:uncharacterized protein YdcH (DUF465 family)
MPNLEALKQDLLRTNETYRQLHDEHQECEARLAQLSQRSLPSQEDEAEEKRLKVHKLALKDRMEVILRQHRESGVSA